MHMFFPVLLILCCVLVSVSAEEYLENGASAIGDDIGVPTCIANMNIHKDNIIRTQDSRAMGARYLNEIELDSQAECLRLCCETQHCDVFVYEEKGAGSCYLFECGPPKDFKCKFTHHVNYTSGILALSRHAANADLETEIQHEKDLAKLRKPEGSHNANEDANVPHTTPSTATTATTPPLGNSDSNSNTGKEQQQKTVSPLEKSSKCSRNQFECRSTKECIAIYNACDGVPQCADGSDEAAELGCPPDPVNVAPPSTSAPSSRNNQHMLSILNGQDRIEQHQFQRPSQEIYLPPVVQHNLVQVPLAHVGAQQDFGGRLANSYNPLTLHQSPQAYYQSNIQQTVQDLPQDQASWYSHSGSNVVQQPLLLPDKSSSHIFNHKSSGIQVPAVDESDTSNRYNKYKGAMQTLHRVLDYARPYDNGQMPQHQPSSYADPNPREYAKPVNFYNGGGGPSLTGLSAGGTGGGGGNGGADSGYDRQQQQLPLAPLLQQDAVNNWRLKSQGNYGQPNDRFNTGADVVQTRLDGDWQQNEIENHPSNVNYNPIVDAATRIEKEITPKHDQDKMAHELKHSKEHFEAPVIKKASADSKDGTADDGGDNVNVNHDNTKYSVIVEEMAETIENIEDGIAETPSGAVLSLTLGLIITFMMAILIGCRLRVVRRRIRRGGKSYAHDADYLVNGMYL